jgi:hypothetical protein
VPAWPASSARATCSLRRRCDRLRGGVRWRGPRCSSCLRQPAARRRGVRLTGLAPVLDGERPLTAEAVVAAIGAAGDGRAGPALVDGHGAARCARRPPRAGRGGARPGRAPFTAPRARVDAALLLAWRNDPAGARGCPTRRTSRARRARRLARARARRP